MNPGAHAVLRLVLVLYSLCFRHMEEDTVLRSPSVLSIFTNVFIWSVFSHSLKVIC